MSNRYRVGRFELMPSERQLCLQGSTVPVGSRAFDLLVTLVEHRDRVLMKDELMMRVWPGVVVEENNLTVQVSTLRKLLGPHAIATIPGRGYQLTLEVTEVNGSSTATGPMQLGSVAALPLPDKPSVAVLPFSNLSGESRQEYFVDGIVEDIITELSRFRSLFVIARNSTFTYKGRNVDVRTIAKELGVRYVVEGSIRRAGKRVRVTAQLIDAVSGSHIWAERYDRVIEEIFEVQEEVTKAIVAAIAPQIEVFETERARKPRPGNLSAYELGMRAWGTAQLAFRHADRAGRDEAIRLAREAISIDAGCGVAWRSIAAAAWQDVLNCTAPSVQQACSDGIEAARRAIAIDADQVAHGYKSLLLLYDGRGEAGLEDMRRAYELNPNSAFLLSVLGFVETVTGNPTVATEYIARAMRLSPRDPWHYVMVSFLGWAYFGVSEYRKASDAARASLSEAPGYRPARLCLVVTLVGLGEIEQAKCEYQSLLSMAPEYATSRLDPVSTPSDHPSFLDRRVAFLRIAAGLQEVAAPDV